MKQRRSVLVSLCVVASAGCGSGSNSPGTSAIVSTFESRIELEPRPIAAPVSVLPGPASALDRLRQQPVAERSTLTSRLRRDFAPENGAFVAHAKTSKAQPIAPAAGKARLAPSHASITVTAPRVSNQAFRIEDGTSRMVLDVKVRGVSDVPAALSQGYVVYPSAVHGGHWIHRATESGVEDYVSFDSDANVTSLSYDVALTNVAALRLVGNSLEFLDVSGSPRLRVPAPSVVGSDHKEHPAKLAVKGCTVDTSAAPPWGRKMPAVGATNCTVEVDWSGASLTYPAVIDPSWIATTDMAYARHRHAAAATNGRVLVAGDAWIEPAEIYDPDTGTWALTGSLAHPRYDCEMTTLPDGRVMITGGDGIVGSVTQAIRPTELWDPATGFWSSSGDLITPRTWHQATALSDGTVLVTGGNDYEYEIANEVVQTVERWSGGTWQSAAPLATIREGHTATLLNDGRVLVAGGNIIDESKSGEVFDPVLGTWTQTGTMGPMEAWPYIPQRTFHAATLRSDGHVLVAGGVLGVWGSSLSTAEEYDPATNAWTTAGNLSAPRGFLRGVNSNGKQVFVGGANAPWYPASQAPALATVDVYDAQGWSSTNDTLAPRLFHTATAFRDGILITGGLVNNQPVASAEVLITPPPQPSCANSLVAASANDPAEKYLQELRDRRAAVTGTAAEAKMMHAPGTITIPVYFHVITRPRPWPIPTDEGVMEDSNIVDQIAYLNQVFATHNTPFKFRLMDISRTSNEDWFQAPAPALSNDPPSQAEVAMKSSLRRGGRTALNVYTTSGGGQGGWGTFPWQYLDMATVAGGGGEVPRSALDGIVVEYFRISGVRRSGAWYNDIPDPAGWAGYGRGTDLVHETGHWLGLLHTFQGGCDDFNDGVADTAAHTEPQGKFKEACLLDDTCPGGEADPIANFMNYTPDECLSEFKPGQVVRMDEEFTAFRSDAKDSILLVGGSATWSSVPTATLHLDNGQLKFAVNSAASSEPALQEFGSRAANPAARPYLGDFTGRGFTDVALTGPLPAINDAYWNSLHIAHATGKGGWNVSNDALGEFANWGGTAFDAATAVADFDGNGFSDILFLNSAPIGTVRGAFGGRAGFTTWNGSTDAGGMNLESFVASYQRPGVQAIVADFDGDQQSEILLIGDTTRAPHHYVLSAKLGDVVAGDHSLCDETCSATPSNFHERAARFGVIPLTGDFDGNGLLDVALLGDSTDTQTTPIAYSDESWDPGFFVVSTATTTAFSQWAAEMPCQKMAADFNGDGITDLALIGQLGTMPRIAVLYFTKTRGHFRFDFYDIDPEFGALAVNPKTKLLIGDFNRDGLADIALTSGLTSQGANAEAVPVAFSKGNIGFTLKQIPVSDLAFMDRLRDSNNDVRSFAGQIIQSVLP